MTETRLEVPQGTFELHRHPAQPDRPLRAWDAADEFALAHLDELGIDAAATFLLLNDTFGALGVVLADRGPVIVNESCVGRIGTTLNHVVNARPEPRIVSILDPLPERIDVLVVKIPRSAGQLEEQLHLARPQLHRDSLIVGAGMTRHIHTSTLELFESIVGPTTTSLARKKARLVHSTLDPRLKVGPNPWPTRWTHDGLEIVSHGGVFSARAVDQGSAFMLENLPEVDDALVIDLGCGNAILGATLAARSTRARLCFFDESYLALQSARETWNSNGLGERAEFFAADRLVESVEPGTSDLIVCNPPFHIDRSRGDETAWQMFVDGHKVLRPGGELRVVGNRHLGYHAKLKKIFGNCETIASNRRFVVLSSLR